MPRIRTIKPEFTRNDDLSKLPAEAHLFAAGLLCYSDDEGYFNANPQLLKADIFPLRDTSLTVPELLSALEGIDWIRLGVGSDGKPYGRVVKFVEHQRVNRPTRSKIAPLCPLRDSSSSTHPPLTEDSPPERKGKEGNGREGCDVGPASPENPQARQFDGQDWCLRTVKLHPKWEAPDAVEVPRVISDAYMEAVELHAKSFHGDRRQAAEDILARTRQFAKHVEGDKIMVGVLNFFKNGVYLEHQPVKPKADPPRPLTAEEELAILDAAERRREERLAAIRTKNATKVPAVVQ